jgi:hypothetical protein
MSNDDLHQATRNRPVGEGVGKEVTQALSKWLERVGVALTLVGLFASIGGVETVISLTGICLTYAPRSKRLMRWVGDKTLPKLKF